MVLNGWYMLMTRRSMQFWLKVIGRQWLIILNIVFLISRNGQLKITWNSILKSSLRNPSPLSLIHVADSAIEPITRVMDLGVILDSGLDMQYHVSNKCKSAAMGLHSKWQNSKVPRGNSTVTRVTNNGYIFRIMCLYLCNFRYFLQKQTFVDSGIKISRTTCSYITDKPQFSKKNDLIKSFTPPNQSVILNCSVHFDTPWWFTLQVIVSVERWTILNFEQMQKFVR